MAPALPETAAFRPKRQRSFGGLGALGAIALAFYAVGRSEDLDRERGRG